MSNNDPHVTVLMATYNGEKYLPEQIESILQQTHKNLTIIASDDGSTDRTLDILNQYNIVTHTGSKKGFAANFLSLINKVELVSEYYAYSDQDDIWEHDKVAHALKYLQSLDNNITLLYCARTLLVDEQLNHIGYSPLFKRSPSFCNALAQSIAGGNTMIFNKATILLLRQTQNINTIIAHDWWTYLLITGAGGTVIYDPQPHLKYRQHSRNLIGSNTSWAARLQRIIMLFNGELQIWITNNNQHLLAIKHLLTNNNQNILNRFIFAKKSWWLKRLFIILKLKIYRQTNFSQFGLIIGIIFNKI